MYQRIKAALINPSANQQYMHDKWYQYALYVLIYVLLFTIPYLSALINLGPNLASTLASSATFSEEVNYEIKDGKLEASEVTEASATVLKFSSSLVYETYLVIGHDIDYQFPNGKQILIIHLDDDGIYYADRNGENIAFIMGYDDQYLDLRLLNDGDQATINGLFNYVSLYLKAHMGLVLGIGIPILLLTNTIYVLGIALMISLFSFISFRMRKIRFSETFKMAILSMTPIVICFMFSIFLKRSLLGNLLYWTGFIITTIYNYRLGISYFINKTIKETEENNHEL